MKCGFAAIIGRPSAGKSTLLNALCGEKVAITSTVPQTTRNAIRGIINRSTGQIIFLDTPGYHDSDKKLNNYLKDVVHRSLNDADVVLYVVDASRSPGKEEQAVMDLLKKSGKPVIAAVNKTDLDTPLLTEIRGLVQVNLAPKALIDVSAVKETNLESLVLAVLEQCPEGELHYPTDFYTDQNPEFRISEIIREQAIIRSEQEVPHALYVEIADMEFEKNEWYHTPGQSPGPGVAQATPCSAAEPRGMKPCFPGTRSEIPEGTSLAFRVVPQRSEERSRHTFGNEEDKSVEAGVSSGDDKIPVDTPSGAPAGFFDESPANDSPESDSSPNTPKQRKKLWVRAFLVVERESQVGILVGHKGAKIKSIRIGALKEMKKIFPWKVRLDLRVKVNPKWRKKDPLLKQMLGSGK